MAKTQREEMVERMKNESRGASAFILWMKADWGSFDGEEAEASIQAEET